MSEFRVSVHTKILHSIFTYLHEVLMKQSLPTRSGAYHHHLSITMKSTKTNTKAAKKKANASPLRQKRRNRSKDSDRGVPSVEVTTREDVENIKPLKYEEKEDKSTKPVKPKFAVGTRMAKYFYDGEQESLFFETCWNLI